MQKSPYPEHLIEDLSMLHEFLDFKAEKYENKNFITSDPIQIVHQFTEKEDIEIIGLLVATIAWGNRKSIIKSGERLVQIMHGEPHNFILHFDALDADFVHRTFNRIDLTFFLKALQHAYKNEGGLQNYFVESSNIAGVKGRIYNFREKILQTPHEKRSEKHLSNPLKNSAAKRINMYLRWMVRSSNKEVDFGVWKHIPTSALYLPLDVHTGNIARKLGLLTRKQNDWKALEEVMENLREFDAGDPVKYDFALFGLGAFEGFGSV